MQLLEKVQVMEQVQLREAVQTFETMDDGRIKATGTSNGVGWTIEANFIFKPYTNMSGGRSFNDLPGSYDDVHVGSDFTITFDRDVTSVLIALGNQKNLKLRSAVHLPHWMV